MSLSPDGDDEITVVDYVKSRLDSQDHVLKAISEDVKATRKQATKTNGRVTKLEKEAELQTALREQAEKIAVGRRWWINICAGACFVISGAVLGDVIHLIHIG